MEFLCALGEKTLRGNLKESTHTHNTHTGKNKIKWKVRAPTLVRRSPTWCLQNLHRWWISADAIKTCLQGKLEFFLRMFFKFVCCKSAIFVGRFSPTAMLTVRAQGHMPKVALVEWVLHRSRCACATAKHPPLYIFFDRACYLSQPGLAHLAQRSLVLLLPIFFPRPFLVRPDKENRSNNRHQESGHAPVQVLETMRRRRTLLL